MKALKIGFTLFAMLMMITFANAQSTEKESIKEKTERYAKALNLDQELTNKAIDLNLKYEKLIANASTPTEKKNFIGEHENKVKELLTEEQYAKYKEMVAKEKRQKMSGPRPRPTQEK